MRPTAAPGPSAQSGEQKWLKQVQGGRMGQCWGLVSVRVREASGGALRLPTQVLLDEKSVRIYSLQADCSNPWFPSSGH